MANFDRETGNLVLYVVYDGLPHSGKTESVKSLGKILGQQVFTPEEAEGRTLYFDWLDYQGGICLGRPIQCRVLTVPGQTELAERRSKILAEADVVVLVADSTPDGFEGTQEHFNSLLSQLARRSRDIPILLQLNKRDMENALTTERMLSTLGEGSFRRSIQSIATTGSGIRETFVFAVSEAIRDLKFSKNLYTQESHDASRRMPDSPEQMLDTLTERETKPIARQALNELFASSHLSE